jgi:response regulator RpfG family c-di-GMP phosphodiesterase
MSGKESEIKEKKAKTLVVDDEELIRDLMVHTLNNYGYEVETAGNADDALERMDRSSVELALIDIQMPGKSGIELLGEIVDKYPDTAVVMVSGINEIDTALTTMKMGAYDYITKPFTPSVVAQRIELALEKRRLIIENRNYQLNLEKLVKERTEELVSTYDATIKALGGALDLRDSETEDHCRRVAAYVLKLAKIVGIEDEKILRDLELGAFLHDIGKIGVPDAILLKPGKLTEEEKKVIETHPGLGNDLIKQIQFLKGASELVLSHHEWFDGSGYPRGLRGSDIPLPARLFTVADTIDAMTSDRPYRKALPIEAVGKELRKLSGVQFDPQIVDAFFSVPEREWGTN